MRRYHTENILHNQKFAASSLPMISPFVGPKWSNHLRFSSECLSVQVARCGRVIRTGGFVERGPVHAPGSLWMSPEGLDPAQCEWLLDGRMDDEGWRFNDSIVKLASDD